jgi:hypothetical protein
MEIENCHIYQPCKLMRIVEELVKKNLMKNAVVEILGLCLNIHPLSFHW